MDKVAVAGFLPEELCASLSLSPSFRGNQIFQWIGKGADSFDAMTNLSAELRASLAEKALLRTTRVSDVLKADDGTVKLQIETEDALAVETVLLTDKAGRKTACVSCQAGCAMGCAFCKTGTLGFARNLSAAEIVEQFLFLEKYAGALDNIVFMGMGEPLLNLDALRKAIAVLTDKRGRNLSSRRITVSTVGIVSGIYDLADNGPAVRLAVSLTTADEELRRELMPASLTNPLSDLRQAISYYIEKTGKRVTLEAVLLSGKNTSEKNADSLIAFAKDLDVHVNLIPWNPVAGLPFATPDPVETAQFVSRLEKGGLNVTLRMHRGKSISGACGQLGKTNANA